MSQGVITTGEAKPVAKGRTLNVEQLRRISAAVRPAGGGGIQRTIELVAVAMVPLGASLILLGWFGAANSILVQEQLPYLISGGMLGTALLVGGGMLYLGSWVAKLAGQNREQQEALRNTIELLREDVRSLRGAGAVAWPADGGTADDGPSMNGAAVVATPSGTMYHLPTCGVVSGRDDLHEVDEEARGSMKPCGMCEPLAA